MRQARPGSARGCRGRRALRMRPARRGTGSRGNSRSVAWSVWSRRRARSRARVGTTARVDHEDRVRSRPPAARRGRLALPRPAERRPRAYRPPTRPAYGGDRSRVERSAAAASHLDTAGSTRQAPHDHRGRCRTRAERLLLGGHPNRVKSPAAHNFIPSAGSVAARQRAGNPRLTYEQPAPTGWPRPILDSGSPRRTMVLRYPNPRISV